MADLKEPTLTFEGGCPDCGERAPVLPIPLPGVADDFDWASRDYDSFRHFMLRELIYRFPERRRWTTADMEVVIVELLSAALDRSSHALDAVQAERYLETARRPQSVRRLLNLIGYDAVRRTDPAVLENLPPLPPGAEETPEEKLERHWRLNPAEMEKARSEGPRLTVEVRRMVTLADHKTVLETHPLVARARARLVWSGAWYTVLVAALLEDNRPLDDHLHEGPPPADGVPSKLNKALWDKVKTFQEAEGLALPPINKNLTPRRLLRVMIERNRMVGSEVFLETAKPAAVTFTLSVRAKKGYFRTELDQALNQVFAPDKGGFFEPGRMEFGEDLFASDIIETAMAVEGVALACLNRFKRVGAYPDRTAAGFIEIADDEFVLCENNPTRPENGTYRITVHAGEVA